MQSVFRNFVTRCLFKIIYFCGLGIDSVIFISLVKMGKPPSTILSIPTSLLLIRYYIINNALELSIELILT